MLKIFSFRRSGRTRICRHILAAAFLAVAAVLAATASADSELPIIPWPNQIELREGGFPLEGDISVRFDEKCADTSRIASNFMDMISVFTNVSAKANSRAARTVSFALRPDLDMGPESYRLDIGENKIEIRAVDPAGMFYAVQTIRQLLPPETEGEGFAGSALLPALSIEDSPRFAWRGIMLDESRHFFGRETVMDLLDKMAFYKLNRFHWHLTDSPGWRLEIKQYPKLATVGGRGDHSDSDGPAQYYTQDEIAEIVEYAAERFITIIPEIDMPGHARAANRAYPEFSGGGSDSHPEFTFNPANPATIEYLKNILNEVAELFPGPWLHFGGDEVHFANKQWADDPHVQRLMKNEGLDNILEVEHFFNRQMAEHINSLGKITAGWDEITGAGLPVDSSLVFWWRHNRDTPLWRALKDGRNVVLCPRIPCYFDFKQHKSLRRGRKWGTGISTLPGLYSFPDSITKPDITIPSRQSKIMGMQACIWTEGINTVPRLEFMTFPRIAALAESSWSRKENKDFDDFQDRLENHLKQYEKWGVCYFNPFDPDEQKEP